MRGLVRYAALLYLQLACWPLGRVFSQLSQDSPYFEQPVRNVTARVGRPANLTCVVENLGHYKVAWGYKGTGAVLTVATQVITNNHRITVHKEQRSTWILNIANITLRDQGGYWCQVNTAPPRSLTGFLIVVEPPVLDGGDEDIVVASGESVNLTCEAHGTPAPTLRWLREDYRPIRLSHTVRVPEVVGGSLQLTDLTPASGGGYLCIATNGYPPSVSKRVKVMVKFAPLAMGLQATTGALLGSSVSLTCLYAAYPPPRVSWRRDNSLGSQLLSHEYFTVTSQEGSSPYTHNMTLQMRNLVPSDFGLYTCIVKNNLGQAEAKTLLKELARTTTTTTTTTATTTPTATTTTTTTFMLSPPVVYRDYDDIAKNLTAPLVVNTSPNAAKGPVGVRPAPSRDQNYGTRKSRNKSRINILDTKSSGVWVSGSTSALALVLPALCVSLLPNGPVWQ